MKPSLLYFLILVLALGTLTSKAQFSGDFAFSNWQMATPPGGAGGVANGTPGFVIVTGPNGVAGGSSTDFTIAAPATAMISFDWEYESADDPGYDPASYIINGEEFFISDQPGTSGSQSVVVEAGEVFGFRVRTTDGCCGAASIQISNFTSGPLIPGLVCESPVPLTEGSHFVPATTSQYYWYAYTMPNTPGQKLVIETAAEKEVTIFQGECDNLDLVGEGFQKVKLIGLAPTQTVWIRWLVEGEGDFEWTLETEALEPGDACTSPLPAVLGENILPASSGENWYSFTMPAGVNKVLTVTMEEGLDLDIYFESCDDLSQLAEGEGSAWIQNMPGEQIFIVWNNTQGEELSWTLSLDGDASSCDEARSAEEGLNYSAQAPGWYHFTMPATGNLRITSLDLFNTDPDTWLNVQTNCNTDPFAFNDDFSFYQSEVNLSLQAGQQIIIHWNDTYSSEQFYWELDLSNLEQEIEFNPLDFKIDTDVSFELTATATSGLPVSYSSSNPSIASISGNVVTIHSAGKVDITASQSGNEDYLAASEVVQELTIKQSQTITFEEIPAKYINSAPFALVASVTSGLPITFQSTDQSVATISGGIVTILSEGTTKITASQEGNDAFAPALSIEQILTITKVPQQITFDELPQKSTNSEPFDITASSTSGLPVSFTSSNPTVATVSGNTVTVIGAGTTTITATQSGDDIFAEAQSVDRLLTINKLSQEITFEAISEKFVNTPPFALTASSTSGLSVSFSSSNPSVATVSGNIVTIVGSGMTIITASQEGNNVFAAASTERVLTVSKLSQNLSFSLIQAKKFNDAPFELVASSTSGLPVSFQSNNPSVATVSGNTVTILSAGIAGIEASQSGNAQYLAAPSVERVFVVNKLSQTITFNPIEDKTFPIAAFTLDATTDSGLPITYVSSDESVATVADQTVTIVSSGIITIIAQQPGNPNYEPATQVSRTFCVKPPAPIIESNFANPEAPTLTSGSPSGNEWHRNNAGFPENTPSTLTVTQPGEYKVRTTTKGCTSEFSEAFVVLITSIGDEFNSISLQPNPAVESITVKGVSETSILTIISASGTKANLTQRSSREEKSITVDISPLASGLYYVLCADGNRIRVTKFIKQ